MEITKMELQHYAERHTTAESDLLRAINRETHARILKPRMLSGHLQGRILATISHMI
ncbi:MAG: methyltransferase, partial [Cyclobacteriaceae bacterium]|nr:methyltransferase [Cyclobacteriaceae bacterium]